jgi:nuclear exosome regulator NRDE2
MSAPSFSSFPPSFGSLPDLDKKEEKAGPSGQKPKNDELREEHSKKNKHRDRDKRRDKHDRDGRRTKDHSGGKDGKLTYSRRDDEQVKREEDRHARLGATYSGGAPGLFVVDKVGDQMNVVYGGIHGGDIPKYRRTGCRF